MAILAAAWAIAQKIFGLMPIKDWLIAALLAVIVGYHLYAVHEARVAGRAEGAKDAQLQCAAEKKAAQADYDRRVKEADDKNKSLEEQQATELAIAGANYEKALQDAEDQRTRDVAAARSGALKLRVAGMCPRAPASGPPTQATTAASGGDGSSSGELPPEVTRRLFELADDADATARQLSACQTVIQTYLKGQS